MLIATSNKEFPNCPFLYDQNTTTSYPVLYCSKQKVTKESKFYNAIKNHISLDTSKDIEYFVNIQVTDETEREIYLSYHTWLILALNPNIKILPVGIDVSANFDAGIYPIYATIKEAYSGNIKCVKTTDTHRTIRQGMGINTMTKEYAKITNNTKKINLNPSNSCNFILKSDDYPISSFFSVISNATIYITEDKDYITHTKLINKSAVTLHMVIRQISLSNINSIVEYINNTYDLNVVLQKLI
jgi:hypothetical protein